MTPFTGIPRELRGPLAGTATIVLLALILAVSALLARQQAADTRDAAAARQSQAAAKLLQTRQEAKRIREGMDLFRRLESQGLVGEAQYPEWAELLHSLRQRGRLPTMSYEFAPAPVTDSETGFHRSGMTLRLQLLHEQDLLDFLAGLRQEAKALIQLRHCRLVRLPDPFPAGQTVAARLSADCEMDWIKADPGTP